MSWHPVPRPRIAESREESRYTGLVIGGSFKGEVVTRHKELFVMVKQREDEWGSVVRYPVVIEPGCAQ